METMERSFTDSETQVIRNMVTNPRTVLGIVSRFVVNVPNLCETFKIQRIDKGTFLPEVAEGKR